MNRRVLTHRQIVTSLVLTLFVVAAQVASAAFPITVKDDLGQQVTLKTAPQRIISMAPSNTEILFALGLGDRVVAVDMDSNYPPAAKSKESVGSGLNPSLERIVALRPDLVLLWDSSALELQQKLIGLGVTAATFTPTNLSELYTRIGTIGRLTGAEQAAQNLVAGMQRKVATVTSTVAAAKAKPLVLYEVWPDPLFTVGPGSFMDELITLAGGRNIAADAKTPWPVLSAEVAIARNPDVILTPFDKSMSIVYGPNRAAWSQVSAVRSGRVHLVDQDLVSRPGPRLVDGLLAIAKALHPGLF